MVPYIFLIVGAVAAVIEPLIAHAEGRRVRNLLRTFAVLQVIILLAAMYSHRQVQMEKQQLRLDLREVTATAHNLSQQFAVAEVDHNKQLAALSQQFTLAEVEHEKQLTAANAKLADVSKSLSQYAVQAETEIVEIIDAVGGKVLGVEDGHVTKVSLADTSITDNTLVHVNKLEHLIELDVRNTHMTSTALGHIGQLTRLQSLYLNDTDINNLHGIERLSQLKTLELDYTSIRGSELWRLRGLTSLEELSLYVVADVDDEALVHIGKLVNLTDLALSGTKVTDDGLVQLKNLSNLSILRLSSTNITDDGLVYLKQFPKLTQVWLGYTGITDEGLRHLASLRNLFNLQLEHTSVSDAGLMHIQRMPKLRHLNLGGTKVTDDGVERLRGVMPNLRNIDR